MSEGGSAWRLEAGDEALVAELCAASRDAVHETALVPETKVAEWLKLNRTGALRSATDTLALPP